MKQRIQVYVNDQLMFVFSWYPNSGNSGVEALAAGAYALRSFEMLKEVEDVLSYKARLDGPQVIPTYMAKDTGVYSHDEIRCLLSAKKIEAIKLYRTRTSVGVKEAKDAIEVLEALVVKHIKPMLEAEYTKLKTQEAHAADAKDAKILKLTTALKMAKEALGTTTTAAEAGDDCWKPGQLVYEAWHHAETTLKETA